MRVLFRATRPRCDAPEERLELSGDILPGNYWAWRLDYWPTSNAQISIHLGDDGAFKNRWRKNKTAADKVAELVQTLHDYLLWTRDFVDDKNWEEIKK